jgi:hypothetical protein
MQTKLERTKPESGGRSAVGLFLCYRIRQWSAEFFFLLNIFCGEGGCKVFWLEDLADLDLEFACVAVKGLDLQEREAGDEFLGFGERTVGDDAVLAGEVDASALEEGWRPS